MTATQKDPRIDRLYELLPAIYRIRDAEQGEPLKALLRVIAEQVNVLEDDITQLYDNWFIETAQDWAVPYLAELIGYTPVATAGEPVLGTPEVNRVLIPRRDVANTLRSRRRKGTLALLEELARDVSSWPARAVELYRLLSYAQGLNFLRQERGRTTDVHDPETLERLNGPFDTLAHSVDVRRIQSKYSQGLYNIPSVGLYVWRLKAYSVTETPATCLESVAPNAYTFSVLGNDAPLFTREQPELESTHIAEERNLPVPIRRRALENELEAYKLPERHPLHSYGSGRSFQLWRGIKQRGKIRREVIPAEQLIVADLSDWHAYRPKRGTVAVDPVLGRLLFPPNQLPAGVWVSYHYGLSGDIGGGEYSRPVQPPTRPDEQTFVCHISKQPPETPADEVPWAGSVEEALAKWREARPQKPRAILEITDSEVYSEQLSVPLYKDERLTLRAANRTRPVIYLLDRERNKPDALTIFSAAEEVEGAEHEPLLEAGGSITLDGLLIAGRAVHVEGAVQCVTVRHCTLVPGWDLEDDCHPKRPAEPSLELYQTTARIRIEKSILGSILVYQDEVKTDPVTVELSDSILDATSEALEAFYALNEAFAHATLTIRRSTVLGAVKVHAIALGESSIFTGRVRVARRQLGCLRYSYVPHRSRTPRRYRCQPDLVEAACREQPEWKTLSPQEQARALPRERLRVRPQFDNTRYGTPTYARLAKTCTEEIRCGAEYESEMGAFYDLFEPQRLANLEARLNEYSPARTDIAVILAD